MVVARIAPEVDRLVWAVNHRAALRGSHVAAFEAAGIGDVRFGDISNLGPVLRSGRVSEDVFLSRYRYRPPGTVLSFVARLVETGCLETVGTRYRVTDRLRPALDAVAEALADMAAETWAGHDATIADLSPLVRRVIDAAPSSDMMDAYREAPEPEPAPALLYQRLAILRLVRNEAHARAWADRGLSAQVMVDMTALWSGEGAVPEWQGPVTFVNAGKLTAEGERVREDIEADTNRRNQKSFDALSRPEQEAFLDAVTTLPGEPP